MPAGSRGVDPEQQLGSELPERFFGTRAHERRDQGAAVCGAQIVEGGLGMGVPCGVFERPQTVTVQVQVRAASCTPLGPPPNGAGELATLPLVVRFEEHLRNQYHLVELLRGQ
jgi:hypothetical protein